jgi:hypothetical protein
MLRVRHHGEVSTKNLVIGYVALAKREAEQVKIELQACKHRCWQSHY